MAKTSRIAGIAVLAGATALAVILGGCWYVRPTVIGGSSAIITSDTAAVPDSQTADATSVPPVAPRENTVIFQPLNWSKTRKVLLDSARKKLGSAASFYVYQLFVQGDAAAVGDLQETRGQRRRLFFVWVGPPWQAVWYTPVGDGPATMQRALHGVPELTSELARKIDWSVVQVKVPDKAAIQASLASAAKQWSGQLMSGKGTPYQISLIRSAKTSGGAWWGRVIVQPTGDATNQYESIEYWAQYKNGAWTGKAQDPEPPSPTTYFPSGVTVTLFK